MKRSYELHPLKVEFLFMKNYAYILVDKATRQAAVVDPAWDLELLDGMLRSLEAELACILLTHSHHDHVNKVEPLLKLYPAARAYMSVKEIDAYGFACRNLHPFEEGETIWLGETPISCMLTPGHTAGGACFRLADDLITGDTVFIEGCGVCDGAGGSPEQMHDSFQRIRKSTPPHVRVYPGHSYGKEPGMAFRDVLEHNIYFQIEQIEHFVRFRMRKNQGQLFNFK